MQTKTNEQTNELQQVNEKKANESFIPALPFIHSYTVCESENLNSFCIMFCLT